MMWVYYVASVVFLTIFTTLNVLFSHKIGIKRAQAQTSIISSVYILSFLCLKQIIFFCYPLGLIQDSIDLLNELCLASATACMLQEIIVYEKYPEFYKNGLFYNLNLISAVYCMLYTCAITDIQHSIYTGISIEIFYIILSITILWDMNRYHIIRVLLYFALNFIGCIGLLLFCILSFKLTLGCLIISMSSAFMIYLLMNSTILLYKMEIKRSGKMKKRM
jgi:hypothetical protein